MLHVHKFNKMAFAVVSDLDDSWLHRIIFVFLQKLNHLRFLSFDCLVHFFTYPPVTGTSHQLHNLKQYISVHIGSNEVIKPRVTFLI